MPKAIEWRLPRREQVHEAHAFCSDALAEIQARVRTRLLRYCARPVRHEPWRPDHLAIAASRLDSVLAAMI